MTYFNRVVTVLVIVVLWIIVVLLAAVPEVTIGWARQGLDALEQSLARGAAGEPAWLFPVLRAGALLFATLVALLLMRWQLGRKRISVVKVKATAGGEAAVTAESIARRLAWHVDQLADVIKVTPQVRTRGSAVDVQLDLQTSPDVDVPMKTEEVIALTRDVIQNQMGLQVNKVKVNVDHAPYARVMQE
jgi:uncharacterized alkaline shock family protein YloU